MPSSSPPLESADSLYRGFPDFTAWGPLHPEDDDLWSRFAAGLEERRKAATPEALKASVDVAIRAAAIDTGAIEGLYSVDRGFTMTVAVQGLAWEHMIKERGADVRELFEAQLTGYELVLDAVTQKLPITEAWIRALHETLCAPQETHLVSTPSGGQEHELPKGQYKTQPNHVLLKDGTYHAYAPVDQVSAEMHRLVEQLRSPEFETAHPVLQASWAHYAFVAIHPFADGNGRVARALASVYFYRCCSIPLLIFANQKFAYWDALHTADLGELSPLIGFFRDRGIDTMQLVVESLRTAELPSPEALAERIKGRFSPYPSLSDEELFNLQELLRKAVSDRLQSHLEQLDIASHISYSIQKGNRHSLHFTIRARDVVGVGVQTQIFVDLADPTTSFPIQIRCENSVDSLMIRLEDIHPEFSEVLKTRLDNWIQRLISHALVHLESKRKPIPGA